MTGSNEVSEGAGDELELSGKFVDASTSSLRFLLGVPRLLDTGRPVMVSKGSREDEVR